MTQITSTYEQQAQEFLDNTQTSFFAKYLKTGKHFDDDKEERDIYEIELKRGKRLYKFNFGQSLNDSGFYYTKGRQKIAIDRAYLDKPNLSALIKGKDYNFLNNGKSDIIHYPKSPTPYNVLACLTKSDPGTFEDFCSEFGYDTDSKRAERTYNAVREEWYNVSRLFTDKEIEAMQEIN